MNRRSVVGWCILFLMTVRPAAGQQSEGTAVPITIAQALEEALSANPSLKASEARRAVAESKTTEARSILLPQIKLSGRAAYLSEVPEFKFTLPPPIGTQTLFPSIVRNYGARVTLQQTVFSGFRTWKQLEIAEHSASAAALEYDRDRSDLALKVTTAYWNLYRASRFEQVIAETQRQVAAHLEDVKHFQKQGMATDVDVLKVQTRLSNIRVQHIEAQGNVRLAQMSLSSIIGRPLDQMLVPSDSPDVNLNLPVGGEDLGHVMAQAKAQRSEVSAAREHRAIQEAAVVAARGGWYPQVVLQANYDYARPNPRVIPPKDAWEKSWDIGLLVQWNIWDWFATSSQTAQAEAGLSQSEALMTQVNDAVALEAAQSYYKVREAKERIEAATLGTHQAEETQRITKEKFQQGVASNTDLLDSEVALLQARLAETQASVDYVVQIERLKRAMGELR